MSRTYLRNTDNWRRLIKLERNVKKHTAEATREAAETLKRDIRDNWSAVRPSMRGNPPAIKTGNLDSSIIVEEQSRTALGRFAGKEGIAHFVRIDTEQGDDPQDRGQYAVVLERGYDRPFVKPAVERLKNRGQSFFKATEIIDV